MGKRNSMVQSIHVTNILFGSILEIGDTIKINGFSQALAVQRREELFFGKEGSFTTYSIFSEPTWMPTLPEIPTITKYQALPNIRVKDIRIKGLSASAVTQIGNTKNVYMDSKVHHIRQIPEGIMNKEEGE
ncbi:spore germination protein GerPE [Lederbergia sp. NSJ-179]|uniref:spore germination protein GerPE n=1 Tax=Lederbergia sp. NSJ-179 TaxID=2931402 RepID=UPI001FD62C52|nr:spore germination protein GerPE [Lederbergia sp. NSJ-179]MCJ7840385.1 spore germination protein GerPE [Lederbergia sp. NSJ-179]